MISSLAKIQTTNFGYAQTLECGRCGTKLGGMAFLHKYCREESFKLEKEKHRFFEKPLGNWSKGRKEVKKCRGGGPCKMKTLETNLSIVEN